MFVSDDHALIEPSTMNLIAKTMTEFFELGAMEGGQTVAAAVEGERQQNQYSPVQKNIEVTEILRPYTCYYIHFEVYIYTVYILTYFGININSVLFSANKLATEGMFSWMPQIPADASRTRLGASLRRCRPVL